MIQVNSTAWHYRLFTWMWETQPRSLCVYFWGCVFALIFAPLRGLEWLLQRMGKVGGWIITVVIVGWLTVLVVMLVMSIIENPWNLLWFPLFFLGIILVTIACVGGGMWVHDRLKSRDEDHQPNLVWEYAKAKKRKVCPLIEVKEADEQSNI